MAHAPTFNEFIPSLEEALLYSREWKRPEREDHNRYLNLTRLFQHSHYNREALIQRCTAIANVYPNSLAGVSRTDAADKIMEVDLDGSRIENGDITVVDAIVDKIHELCHQQKYMFATMFCNHSNPSKYYGYNHEVGSVLVELNRRDQFYIQFDDNYLRRYVQFYNIMQSFVEYYHLEKLTTTQIDVMLKNAYVYYFANN